MARMTRTWWGEVFLEVLTISMDSGRLRRGRPYSGPGRLLKFEIKGGVAKATIRGNKNPYFGVYKEPRYSVTVQLRKFSSQQWERITQTIGGNAAFLSQLLMDEMPLGLDERLADSNLGLLPRQREDLISECSCPDWASPCKHVAGVYYKIASLLDRDPMLLFQLRGLEFDQLKASLSQLPLGQALVDQLEDHDQEMEFHANRYTQPHRTPSPAVSHKAFWMGGRSLPLVSAGGSTTPSTPAVLIKRGGDYPGFWHGQQSFVEVMESLCTRVVDKNKAAL